MKRTNVCRIAVAAVAAVAAAVALVGCAPGSGGDQGGAPGSGSALLIGTAGEGGTYFYLGQGMAAAIEANTDLAATAQGTAGGTENIRRISRGEMDVGLAAPDDVVRTVDDGTADVGRIRVLMSGHATVSHIAVRSDSPYRSLADLLKPGVRLGVGEPGSNVQNQAAAVLGLYGLTLDDVAAAPLSQSEQATALQDGEIDGAFLGGGIPLAAASEVDTNVGARLLPLPEDQLAEHLANKRGEFEHVIPGGTYGGTPDDVLTTAYPTLVLVNADVPDEVAYQLTRTILEHADAIAKVHPAGSEYTVENAFRGADYYTEELGVKFHPGATRYFEEKGAWTGDHA